MTPAEKTASEKKRKMPIGVREKRGPKPWRCELESTRRRLGLSLKDVADAIDMSVSGYWMLESGTDVMLTTAVKIATYFGCTIESLWPERLTGGGK